MNDGTMKIVKIIGALVAFIISIALVVLGQRNIGLDGLLVMLVGLTGLLVLLYLYNRGYTKEERETEKALKAKRKAQNQNESK